MAPSTAPRPFLKWAGGKQRLLQQYEAFFPAGFRRYLEPFVGGGAVFFRLQSTGRLPGRVCLFDHNQDLINAYRVVRDELEQLLDLLAVHNENHSSDYYYQVRGLDRQGAALGDVERAARTIYLNKTCYNGLYRVNRKGQFNVPLGRYERPRILDADNLRAANMALQGVQIEVRGFCSLVDLGREDDFFYFDPPYDPVSKTANFTSYTPGSFRDRDQRDLARVFAQLSDRGCLCMLSNSDTPFVRELYQGFCIERVRANRTISRNTSGRGAIHEVVVLNYPQPGEAER